MDKFDNYRKRVFEFTASNPCPRVLGKFRVTGEDGKVTVFGTSDEAIGFPGVYEIETLNESSPTAAGRSRRRRGGWGGAVGIHRLGNGPVPQKRHELDGQVPADAEVLLRALGQ